MSISRDAFRVLTQNKYILPVLIQNDDKKVFATPPLLFPPTCAPDVWKPGGEIINFSSPFWYSIVHVIHYGLNLLAPDVTFFSINFSVNYGRRVGEVSQEKKVKKILP